MKKKAKKKRVMVHIRMPLSLKHKIMVRARKTKRSMNAQFIALFEAMLGGGSISGF